MKYLYCLARGVETSSDAFPPGMNGGKVYWVSAGEISALISDIDSASPDVSEQNALVHQEVVHMALRHSKSVIPCRFGTLFPDKERLLMFLKEHYRLLDDNLARLEGKVEVSVQTIFNCEAGDAGKMSRPVEPQKPLTAGASYLLRKKEQFDAIKGLEERADKFSQELNQAMSSLWSEVKIQKRSANGKLMLSICYLVEQQKLPLFESVYQKFGKDKPDIRLLYAGPWAPYSFTNIDFREGHEL